MKVGRKRRTSVFYVRYVVHVLKRFVAVVTMACLSSSRLCARVQDKLLCQFGHKVRRQTVFVKLKPPGPSPLRIFGKTCQVSQFLIFFALLPFLILHYYHILNSWWILSCYVMSCHSLWRTFYITASMTLTSQTSADRINSMNFWMNAKK